MKFKVGDRVKCINAIQSVNGELEKEKIYIVSQIDTSGYVELKGLSNYHYDPSRFKKIEYTYEDLKKSPIGIKITFENGIVLVKDSEDFFESTGFSRKITELKKFTDQYIGILGKIIKIEEPNYVTVYENKIEVLDEVEKRYLRGVIRPFRNKVKSIRKTDNNMNGKDNEYLTITLTEEPNMDFPNFEPNSMYQRMKLYKEYTLEELGL